MKRGKIFKFFVASMVAALSLSMFPLAACGGGEVDPEGETNITFMHMWPEHEQVMNQLISKFEGENPGVHVSISINPYDKIEQVLQTAQMSGELPNVYTFYTHYMTPLVSATDGVLAGDVTDLKEKLSNNYVQPDSWEMGKIGGKYYSVPFRVTGELIFYNKNIFTEKGWSEPETFEELELLLGEILADGTYMPLAAGGKENQITYIVNAMSLFSSILDGSVDEPGYAVGRLQPESPEVDDTSVKIYEKVRAWYANGYFGKGAIATSKTGAIKNFTSRTAAMVFANVCNMSEVSSLMPNDEIGVFGIPAPAVLAEEQAVKYVFGGYDGLSYAPDAPANRIAASKKLIEFLVRADIQQILADRTQSIIVSKGVEYHDDNYKAFAEECKYVGAYSTGTDYVTGSNSAGNGTMISSYIAGTSKMTAAEIIRTINDNVYKDMQDSLLNNPTRDWYPRQNAKKEYDRSWLE